MEHKISPLSFVRGLIFVAALIMYLVSTLFPSSIVTMILYATSILLFITAMIQVARFYFIMSLVFVSFSFGLTWMYELSWQEMASGFSIMVKLVLFIGIIPLTSSPIQGYIRKIEEFISYLSRRVSAFLLCHYTSFTLANFINLAALPISKSLFFQEATDPIKKNINAELTLRSFGLAMMCTPIGAAIGVAIDITGTKWSTLLPINLFLVSIGLFLSYYFTKKSRASFIQVEEKENDLSKPESRILVAIFAPYCVYFFILLMIDEYSTLGIMEIIVFSILPFTFLWSVALKKVKEWWETFRNQIFEKTPTFFGQFAVIISAGLVIHTMELAGIDEAIVHLLPGVGSNYASFIYIPLTIFFVLLLAMLGVHQFVAMMFAGKLVHPEAFGIDPTIFSSALLVGFVGGMLASSFSGANILMSNLLPSVSSSEFGRKNYLFTIVFILISTLILVIFNHFFY